MLLEGKVALVTGASRGIGRAIALRLASEGASVAINYAGNTAAAEEVKSMIEANGGKAMIVQADVSDGEAVEAMIAAVNEELGNIDILVNNAGITRDNLLMRIFENFLSPGYVSKTEADSVETELRDISIRTGTNLIPDLPNQSFSFNNEKINLTAEQYEQYVKTRGSLMHSELERLFATDEYKAMSLGAQASCIEDIQKWADEQGKVAVYPDKTFAYKWMDTDDPVPSVLERRASEDKQAYQNEAYSNIQNAIDNDDTVTARDWVYALNQAGVENSDIKQKMTTLYKSEYQYAIRSGDRETARKIEGMLLAMDIGYKAKNFINWEKDAYKEE